MRELALHAQQRSRGRFARAAARLHLDGDRLRFFAMLLRTSTRRGDALLMLAPLLLEAFARRREIVAAADRAGAARFALVYGSNECLLLGREIRDRAIERRRTLPCLIQLGAAGA